MSVPLTEPAQAGISQAECELPSPLLSREHLNLCNTTSTQNPSTLPQRVVTMRIRTTIRRLNPKDPYRSAGTSAYTETLPRPSIINRLRSALGFIPRPKSPTDSPRTREIYEARRNTSNHSSSTDLLMSYTTIRDRNPGPRPVSKPVSLSSSLRFKP